MRGWASRRERRVVLPLPRKPVSSVTGSGPPSGKRRQQLRVERVERAACQLRRRRPQGAEVGDDLAAALAVAQDVGAAGPVVEAEAEVGEHAVDEPHALDPAPAPAALLGPVVAEEHAAEGAHQRPPLSPRPRRIRLAPWPISSAFLEVTMPKDLSRSCVWPASLLPAGPVPRRPS